MDRAISVTWAILIYALLKVYLLTKITENLWKWMERACLENQLSPFYSYLFVLLWQFGVAEYYT